MKRFKLSSISERLTSRFAFFFRFTGTVYRFRVFFSIKKVVCNKFFHFMCSCLDFVERIC